MNPAYLGGALGSVFYGAADFCGGMAARRASAWVVTAFSCVGGLLILLVGLPFVAGAATRADLMWGVAAGACGTLGAALIYRALAVGPVSVASPVLGVTGMAVPIVFGLAFGERPSVLALAGLGLAPIAIGLIAQSGAPAGSSVAAAVRRGLTAGLLAGAVVGFFLVFLSFIGRDAGLAPLVVARVTALALYAAWFTAARLPYLPPAGARTIAFWTGVLDSLANVSFVWAVQRGSLSLVSALVSLSPATTVLLARFVLGERWSPLQATGLAAALAAGALISAG